MTDSHDINLLKIYFGDPYPITDQITLQQPTIGEIIDYGEDKFYAVLLMFIGNTTYRKYFLWQNGIDWNKISDYELFCSLVKNLPMEETSFFFKDIDFEGFDIYELPDPPPEEPVPEGHKLTQTEKRTRLFNKFDLAHTFYNKDQDIEINCETYKYLVKVMRTMFQIFPKTEYAANKATKELMIEEEENKLKQLEKEGGDDDSSTLLPMISACVNHPGFKYKTTELRDVGMYEFMDSVKRLQIYESTRALYAGMYSGFADLSKVPKEQFDFMRSIN